MYTRILLLLLFSYVSLNAQTKLSYAFNVSPQHTNENIALIEDYFGPPKKNQSYLCMGKTRRRLPL